MKKTYLQKSGLYPAFIDSPPASDLRTVIVIPAYDEPDVFPSLHSLLSCDLPQGAVEVLLVINHPDTAADDLRLAAQQQFQAVQTWAAKYNTDQLRFYPILAADLPRKRAGVGLARKIGLDEGVRRLHQATGRWDDPNGVLVCFDADSSCRPDYFQQIDQFFRKNPMSNAVSIGYAHPLAGAEFPEEIYSSIAAYELHLRYFLLAKKLAGYPHAIETIGSAMAVRQWAYQQQGGMNQRKAGEDFYFLHKFIATGTTGEITEPLVIPSPRVSHRVPFGTGKAVGELLDNPSAFTTYAPAIFRDLAKVNKQIDDWYTVPLESLPSATDKVPASVAAFFQTQNTLERLREIRQHTTSLVGFRKRLFRWMDAFWVMKFVHFARDHFYPNVSITVAAKDLLVENYPEKVSGNENVKELLGVYRKLAVSSVAKMD